MASEYTFFFKYKLNVPQDRPYAEPWNKSQKIENVWNLTDHVIWTQLN